VRGDRQPGVALVPDPRVPVVVVPPALQPLRQRGGGGRHHATVGRGQPAQHRVRVPRVGDRDQPAAVGGHLRPGLLGRRPGPVGVGRVISKFTIRDFQNESVLRPGRQLDRHRQQAVSVARLSRARPAEPGPAAAPGPRLAVPGEVRHPAAPVPGSEVERHVDLGRPVDRHDLAQQHRRARVGGHGQRFPALDPGVADPPAAPDQAAGLVVAAPDVPGVGGADGVPPGSAKQPAENSRAVPARHAQPRHRAVRADQGAALAVRDQRVLPQHPGLDQIARTVAHAASTCAIGVACHGIGTSSFGPVHARK
jgi:hypothetical protein